MVSEHDQTQVWLAAAKGGDRLALAKLLALCHPRLRARAASKMDPALQARGGPEDILQEVYLEAVRRIDQFEYRGSGSFLSWMYTILDHKLVDAQRGARCQARDVRREVPAVAATDSYWNLFDQIYADSGTPSRVVRRDEALGALLAGLSNVSESHRQVLQLRFLEGLPLPEVAQQLGKSEGAVVALTKRALAALRQAMDQMGEFTRGA